MPSSASAPASPPSASHSQNSATQPSPRKNSVRLFLSSLSLSLSRRFSSACIDSFSLSMISKADGVTNNDGLSNAEEKKPDLSDQFEYGLTFSSSLCLV